MAKLNKYLSKVKKIFKSTKFKKSRRVWLARATVVITIVMISHYFINVEKLSSKPGLNQTQQQDLRNLILYRQAKTDLLRAKIKEILTEGSSRSANGKLMIMAFSDWMHLVVMQNQVRYDPQKIARYHDELSLYQDVRLFEITKEQGQELAGLQEQEFKLAWARIKGFRLKDGWSHLDSGLQLVALRLQTRINPNLQRFTGNPSQKTARVLQWYDQILAVAKKYQLEPALVAAIIEQESGGNANAISPAGAIGLMQLMPRTARGLGVNPFDPVQNMEGGVKYIKLQLNRFGNLTDALVAYNAGPSRVGQPLFTETQGYVRNVPKLLEKYQPYFKNRKVIDIKPWLPKKRNHE